ncbi:MAG: (2Fe-2S)-binding protein [Gammaproteobacteria bacterium]|nr:(2Fe-2S)-binding protein [Gammaproteobacteria bacterium]MBU1978792.1 (2Fe-2S)-binding protein [Gammaproteobacteria bacterium]
MYVCICKSVTDTQIRRAVNEGACSMRTLCKTLGACSQCGRCAAHVLGELRQALSETPRQCVTEPH